jgi:hypothetical protein
MSYSIIEAQSIEELQSRVQELIEKGWEPAGGIAVATHGIMSWWYYQAMILRHGH